MAKIEEKKGLDNFNLQDERNLKKLEDILDEQWWAEKIKKELQEILNPKEAKEGEDVLSIDERVEKFKLAHKVILDSAINTHNQSINQITRSFIDKKRVEKWWKRNTFDEFLEEMTVDITSKWMTIWEVEKKKMKSKVENYFVKNAINRIKRKKRRFKLILNKDEFESETMAILKEFNVPVSDLSKYAPFLNTKYEEHVEIGTERKEKKREKEEKETLTEMDDFFNDIMSDVVVINRSFYVTIWK